jgi:hypothetical protein
VKHEVGRVLRELLGELDLIGARVPVSPSTVKLTGPPLVGAVLKPTRPMSVPPAGSSTE